MYHCNIDRVRGSCKFFDTLYTMLDPDDYSFDQTKDILYDLFNEFPHCDGDSEIVIFNRGDEV